MLLMKSTIIMGANTVAVIIPMRSTVVALDNFFQEKEDLHAGIASEKTNVSTILTIIQKGRQYEATKQTIHIGPHYSKRIIKRCYSGRGSG